MRTIDDMIRTEVVHNCSFLVSTLAGGVGGIASVAGESSLAELCDQGSELCYPLEDYEEAAREAGWTTADLTAGMLINESDIDMSGQAVSFEGSWQELCEAEDIEPYQREIFEHWIVTDWLADKLDAKGERVDKDFAGLCVWGRTTTGQGIASDSVIEAIYAETHKAEG